MDKIYLLLGTNLGDKYANLRKALSILNEKLSPFLLSSIAVSTIYETAPLGFSSKDNFLNQVVAFDAAIDPFEMLSICKQTEESMGRVNHPERFDSDGERIYESRIIDVDILLFGTRVINHPLLKIPHARLYEREFAITPLLELYKGDFKMLISAKR